MRNIAFVLLVCVALAGCAAHSPKHTASSVVDYLYPHVKEPVVAPAIPVLALPLRVGIAFVPSQNRAATSFALTEKKKNDALNEVANHFRKSPFVKSIEIIPSAYLRPQGSFANLEQIRTMYGVDVIALVSYDQTQFTDQGFLSLTYWTLVGAYVVRGEKNDTHTMLDTVVYDIPSRKLLFRAPGLSQIKRRASLVNLSEQLRRDSEAGISQATAQMVRNLDAELVAFRAKVKERPEEYRVVRTQGYRGGGMVDGLMLALLAAFFGATARTRRK
jgi:rhombotail lipoprotein